MLVCDPELKFYNAYVKWPGSVHDSRVLRRSPLYALFESGFRPFPHAILLGDTGYPSLNWLATTDRINQLVDLLKNQLVF